VEGEEFGHQTRLRNHDLHLQVKYWVYYTGLWIAE
jgi:hypothetical protein